VPGILLVEDLTHSMTHLLGNLFHARSGVLCLLAFRLAAWAQVQPSPTIQTAPGTVLRWTAPGTLRCSMQGRSWAAVQGACYYPLDLELAPGTPIPISRSGSGPIVYGRIAVESVEYGTENITLPDIPQANPSAADLKRVALDRAKLATVFGRKEGPPKFTLPLSPPARPLPPEKSFGVKRLFNGKPDSQPHTGVDYATPIGSPVLAVANGTVAMEQEMFFEGNAVFIDHGNGLISMYFHLADINVKAGQEVKAGQILGRVGSTGRATGPHLFFGIRWHNARVDPRFLLEEPERIPSVSP
jgi:murein DD-endopeptidase MepM/ murein hydrolase activator NlpD